MYATLPVGKLIQRKISESGIRKVDIVRLCGWGNLDKGLRRIDQLINGSIRDKCVLEKLMVILKLDKNELNQNIKLENIIYGMELAKSENEKRINWIPFISAVTELSRPTSITMAAITGGDKSSILIDVPSSISILPFEEQIFLIGDLLQEHYKNHEGKTRFFGKIIGYLYNYTIDYSIELSINGEVTGERNVPVNLPITQLSIGNKKIESALFS